MGRIRTSDVKDVAKDIFEVYPESFGKDFEKNKQKLGELGILKEKTKRYRNRVAGYIVRVARTDERRKAVSEEKEQ